MQRPKLVDVMGSPKSAVSVVPSDHFQVTVSRLASSPFFSASEPFVDVRQPATGAGGQNSPKCCVYTPRRNVDRHGLPTGVG